MIELRHGDCLEVMRTLPDASVDAVVTDPPYGLEFMGKEWDSFPLRDRGVRLTGGGNPTSARGFGGNVAYGSSRTTSAAFQSWCEAWARECYRVLKPGGHMLAFGGDRTHHRLACGIEDAGFEIRTTISWIFGSGFPKSLNVSAALEKIVPADIRCVCAQHSTQTVPGFPGDCPSYLRFDDEQPLSGEADGLAIPPSQADALGYTHAGLPGDGRAGARPSTSPDVDSARPSIGDYRNQVAHPALASQVNGNTQSDTQENTSHGESTAAHKTAHRTPCTPHSDGDSASSSLRYSHLPHCITCGGVQIPQGLGTALKPAHEIITVARKPLVGTVAANVQAYGTGAINVDGCRLDSGPPYTNHTKSDGSQRDRWDGNSSKHTRTDHSGRWPANLLLSHAESCTDDTCAEDCAVQQMDRQSAGASRFFAQFRYDPLVDSYASFPYDGEETGVNQCRETQPGDTSASLTGDGTASGGRKEAGKSISNSNTDGCGSKQTELSPMDTKSTIGTTIRPTTASITSNSSPPSGMTTTTSDCERTIARNRTGPSPEDADCARSGSHSANTPPDEQEHTTATVNLAPRLSGASGQQHTAQSSMPRGERRGEPDSTGRFFPVFRYEAKASTRERTLPDGTRSTHPTVKPLSLMRWLCRLITPPGGRILDPFAGSGSTLVAAHAEGFLAIGIERDPEYIAIAEARLSVTTTQQIPLAAPA